MSFCVLYSVALENHSVQNSPFGDLLVAHGKCFPIVIAGPIQLLQFKLVVWLHQVQ